MSLEEVRVPGSVRILNERARQVQEEGYDAAHDEGHERELMAAAECYLQVARSGPDGWHDQFGNWLPPGGWPWDMSYYKPSEDPVRNLEKAGALIAAAIDAIEGSR